MPQILNAYPSERIQKVTPVFWANKEAYDSHEFRVISNQGSTRSSKTYSLCQLMIAIALESTKSISMVSPSLPHLKKGSRRDFLEIMDNLLLYSDANFNMTDQVYTFPETGSYIEFFGAEDAGKVRGPGRDILYINEANLINRNIYTQLALRTKETIFIDFNPADDFSWVYDVSDAPGNKLIISTYLNNLPNLSKEQVAEIESLRDADPNLWKVFGLGLRGHSSETIYTHWKQCGDLPVRGEVFFGQDFGYNVASALVKVDYWEGQVFAEQLLYETKLTTADLIERYKQLGIPHHAEIFCDNAEPKTIEELCRAGYNAKPADKDVLEGIRKVKSLPLHINHNSIDLIKEVRNYKWKIDKDGKVLDEPIKFNDHCFIGETLIHTSEGLLQINEIVPGCKIFTSNGFKRVLIKHNNGVQQVNKYWMVFDTYFVTLTCTPDHLIKTDAGWIPISKLESGMTIYHSLSLMEGLINATPERGIFRAINGNFTLKYGNISMAQFRRATMFITRMRTRGITQLPIWKLLKRINIFQNILKRDLKMTLTGLNAFKRRVLKLLHYGINQSKDWNGIEIRQQNKNLGNSILAKENAWYAQKNLQPKQIPPSFAIQTAKLKHLDVEEMMPEYVWDLTIEDEHEYFANGILVHNCMDALRYAVFTKLANGININWQPH